jgi:hypothetical protein
LASALSFHRGVSAFWRIVLQLADSFGSDTGQNLMSAKLDVT